MVKAWLRQAVASKLRLNWAPEQIAGWLKRVHPEDERFYVSHETIYRIEPAANKRHRS
jgi:IS30 family transposase